MGESHIKMKHLTIFSGGTGGKEKGVKKFVIWRCAEFSWSKH
jgi:hypothetical protein